MKASAGGFMRPFSGIAAFEALSRSPGLRGALPGTPGEAIQKNQNHPSTPTPSAQDGGSL